MNAKTLNLIWIIFSCLILTAVYFFTVSLFFQGVPYSRADFVDLLLILTSLAIVLRAFLIKKEKAKSLIFLGGVLLFLEFGVEFILSRLGDAGTSFPIILWTAPMALGFVGLILILLGFRRLLK